MADTHRLGSETTPTVQRGDFSLTSADNHDETVPNDEDFNYSPVNYLLDKFDEASSEGEDFSSSSINPIDQLTVLKRQAALGSQDLRCFPVNSVDKLDETTLNGQDITS